MAEPLKLTFRPGINRETTDYGNTGGWYDINLVRWVSQTPQSMGGWQAFTSSAAEGTFRSLFPWSTLNGTRFYGAGIIRDINVSVGEKTTFTATGPDTLDGLTRRTVGLGRSYTSESVYNIVTDLLLGLGWRAVMPVLAATIASLSAILVASGFSTITCLPARKARSV